MSTDWMDALPEAARRYLAGRRLDEVECIVSDLPGIARGKAMPAPKFAKQRRFFLPNSIFFQTITGDWAEAAGDTGFTEPDMVLTAGFQTASAAPWTGDWTLQVIHDMTSNRRPGSGGATQRVETRSGAIRGARLAPGGGARDGILPGGAQHRSGRRDRADDGPVRPAAAARQAYSMSAVDEYGPVIDDIYDFAEAQGFEIDGITQEGGAGQVEINLRHGNPVKLADEVFFFKRLIREAALRHDCFATFMAKPIEGEPGSAMHIHHSVVDTATAQNIFAAEDGSETPAFFHFIGGLQRYLPSAIAILAPYVNSYRRYVPDHSAPINLEWGRDNRTTGIRVPISDPAARRVENRLAGMDCNPYLGIAASLACGYLGW